jgi:hypothetical protein
MLTFSAAAFIISIVVTQTQASLYQIQDTRPSLSIEGQGRLDWGGGGGPSYMLASSPAVRLNFRGIHAYPSFSIIRELDTDAGWGSVTCNLSAWSLCSADAGSVMPSTQMPRMPEDQSNIIHKWMKLHCSDEKGKMLVGLGVYDISACDILDEGLDLVYSKGKLFHNNTSMSTWRYWVSVAVAILLVRSLSYNIQELWVTHQEVKTSHTQNPVIVGSLAILGLVLADVDTVYITTGDQVFFWVSVTYVAFYVLLHTTNRTVEYFMHQKDNVDNDHKCKHIPEDNTKKASEGHIDEKPIFSVTIGTLQILATRLYTSAETPYNLVLTGMLACRLWTKVLTVKKRRLRPLHGLPLVLDSFYLSLCIELAFNGAQELVVAVIGVAFVASALLLQGSTHD